MTYYGDALQFDRINPEGTRYVLLALEPDRDIYRARYRTAEAIFQVTPDPPEIRIPMIERDEKGDFQAILDAMVQELPTDRVRFLGVRHPDDPAELTKAWEAVSPGDGRPIYEAVDGFDFETIEGTWLYDDEVDPCQTLVGRWRVD